MRGYKVGIYGTYSMSNREGTAFWMIQIKSNVSYNVLYQRDN